MRWIGFVPQWSDGLVPHCVGVLFLTSWMVCFLSGLDGLVPHRVGWFRSSLCCMISFLTVLDGFVPLVGWLVSFLSRVGWFRSSLGWMVSFLIGGWSVSFLTRLVGSVPQKLMVCPQ